MTPLAAQGIESEPNDPCEIAQTFGAVALPFSVAGQLTESPNGDVDFYRFSGPPGATLQAELASSPENGVPWPLLGYFDSACGLLQVGDDGGLGLSSLLYFTVPDDGTFILAATSSWDYSFTGGFFFGGYTLTVGPRQVTGPVEGQIVDADTGMPLAGDFPSFANALLLRCRWGGCWEWVQSVGADANGYFSINENFYGEPLLPGHYELRAQAEGYEVFSTGVITLVADAGLNLGTVPLQPRRFIGSLQGRVVDAYEATPLPSGPPSWTGLYLYGCESETACYYFRAQATVDDDGRFFIGGQPYQLEPGLYEVRVYAEQYQPKSIGPFFIAQDEEVDLGDILIDPVRLQMHGLDGCSTQEIGSGRCTLTVQLRNGTQDRLKGEVWALAEIFATGTPGYFSRFQLGRVGATNPIPQKVSLRGGQRANYDFQLNLPSTLSENTLVCVQAFAGLEPNPTYNPENVRDLSCFFKFEGGFQPLTEMDARRMLKEQRSKPR